MSKLIFSCCTFSVTPLRNFTSEDAPPATSALTKPALCVEREDCCEPGVTGVAARERVMVSGLNWKTTSNGGRLRPNSTNAPFKIFGWLVNPLM
jgi:hypothetical protein